MKRHAGRSGTYLISWSQTLIDGHADACEAALTVGAYWRWSGEAVNIACALDRDAEPLDISHDPGDVAAAARGVVARAMGRALPPPRLGGEAAFTVSDGHDRWVGVLIDMPGPERPLIVFAGGVPPQGVPLRIDLVEFGTSVEGAGRRPGETAAVVCFTPGTWIDTPGGARQIEHLAAGDKVMTVDGGALELVWTGSRRMTLRDLHRRPDLAPVRIRAGVLSGGVGDCDLLVSPDHRMLLRNRHAGTGEALEALVSARDLVDGGAVVREPVVAPVTYVHLLLERHHLLIANGFESESFHPAAADLAAVPEADRLRLFDVLPMLKVDPLLYGPWARPALSRAEATLISAA